ncbi:MAG: DUF938 domain-containing protein [Alphaproteobacteria bacterium]|jgi:hypothetical protein|nr:DUF938 domain-containing protein [Alphaproteobacteria bacterium]MBT4019388.1 DUF938 domain-containing protein [Alphaproteobacteria bacterium]MBT5160677.1 DUF938 domain-containing protein [Alphaproteobacteria bacterium]MBT7744548.1 DUF938 domain-containing protein [Alphaproteobacteria bacterium]
MTNIEITPEDRFQADSTSRNAEPIFAVLQDLLPTSGTVLEVASGSGEHGAIYAPRLPHLKWQPSDKDPKALKSIEAWRLHSSTANLLPAVEIDLLQFSQQSVPAMEDVSAMVNANMIHISPWQAGKNLLALAQSVLPSGAPLFLYGPYRRGGEHTAQSNVQFDDWLKSQDNSWGVRNLEDVIAAALECSLEFEEIIDMPANNYSVIFRRI